MPLPLPSKLRRRCCCHRCRCHCHPNCDAATAIRTTNYDCRRCHCHPNYDAIRTTTPLPLLPPLPLPWLPVPPLGRPLLRSRCTDTTPPWPLRLRLPLDGTDELVTQQLARHLDTVVAALLLLLPLLALPTALLQLTDSSHGITTGSGSSNNDITSSSGSISNGIGSRINSGGRSSSSGSNGGLNASVGSNTSNGSGRGSSGGNFNGPALQTMAL